MINNPFISIYAKSYVKIGDVTKKFQFRYVTIL